MSAYFAFEQTSPAGDLKQFVFRLDDPAKIDEAHSILAGAEPLRVRVQGIVVKGAADYNPGGRFTSIRRPLASLRCRSKCVMPT